MDETLQCFLEGIEAQAQADIQALTDSVAAQNREKEEAVRRSVRSQAEEYRRRETAQVQNAGLLAQAARRAENRRRLLAYRQSCAEKTMEAVRAKLAVYTQGKEYGARLVTLMKRGAGALNAGSGPVTVYLRREDMGWADTLYRRAGDLAVTVREGDFALGGLIVTAPAQGRRADMTFDTALRDAWERFGEIAGLELSY